VNIGLLRHVLVLEMPIYRHTIVLWWLAQSDLESLPVKMIQFCTYESLCIFASQSTIVN